MSGGRDLVEVVVEPGGLVIQVGPDETLMAAAERAGYRWPTICGGQASCTACKVRVLDGEGIPPMGRLEADTARSFGLASDERLACQIRPTGSARVRKIGVRRRGADTDVGGARNGA